MSRKTRLNKGNNVNYCCYLGYHQKYSYRVDSENHLDASSTTRGCPNGVCDLGKLHTLVTKEIIVTPQNAWI